MLKLVPTCKKLTVCIVGKMDALGKFLLDMRYGAQQTSAANVKEKGQTKVCARVGNLGFID